jgi:hypothetical protein
MAGPLSPPGPSLEDPLEAVRQSCRRVVAAAEEVTIDGRGLNALATELASADLTPPALDPRCHVLGQGEATVAFFLTLEAVNFGSGAFPDIPGWRVNGYFAVAGALARRYHRKGLWSAEELATLTPAESAALFEIPGVDQIDGIEGSAVDLNRRFTAALNALGEHILERYHGRFAALVEGASGSAARLVERLIAMPGFRDEAEYRDAAGPFPVAFYKRAQLTAADLALAFGGQGWGRFDDLDRLTCFADNQVPHVLRRDGVLRYGEALAERVDGGEAIPAGSPAEVEIRAAAVTAVEALRQELAHRGRWVTAVELDYFLWNRGLESRYAERPAHRTRTIFY